MKLFLILCAFLFGAIFTHAIEDKKTHNDANNGNSDSKTRNPIGEDKLLSTPDSKPAVPNPASHPEHSAEESEHHSDANNLSSKTSKPAPVPSTTSSMKTTTSSTPTTTAAPIDKPGDWNVTNDKNVTCIKVHGIISLNVTVLSTLPAHNETFTINISPEITAIGSCANETIRWNLDSKGKESFAVQFYHNSSSNEFYLSRVDGELYYPNSSKIAVAFKNDSLKAFVTPSKKSYLCRDSVKEHIFHNKTHIVVLTLQDFQIQAFKSSKSNGFDESIDGCPSGTHGGTPDIIPIIVGCMLALLVVIVLVAYLINRRRSQAHGYLSM